ncbi:MAG: UDP-N-acetylmuramoyl-L-alanine--D-glutamate ligase, partial [Bacilli bacterium]|nr:UDP-N-acetylmuramoyl-L-alanine--D-glutamate ligase [Bacilli bacterium]
MYENKKILVLGAAKSGIAVAKLLVGKKNSITLSDMKPIEETVKKELEDLGINIVITDNQLDLISSDFDLIVKNPAIMYTS